MVDAYEITNGVAGINSQSRHVVYVGGKTTDNKNAEDTRTPEQKAALLTYVKTIIAQAPKILIAGHYQFDKKKACPSFDVPAWLSENGIAAANIYTPEK